MAAASTVCLFLVATTLLELCNQINVVTCDILQASCSALSPVSLLGDGIKGICMVNKEADIAIRGCIDRCQESSFALGIVSSSNECSCSNDTAFDLNFCCKDIQCDITCGRFGQQCNQETRQCEYTVPIPLPVGCNTRCIRLGYGGFVQTGSICTCTACNGIGNVTPKICADVSRALLGVSATTSTGDGTCVVTASVGLSAASMCELVNDLPVPGIKN